MSKLLSVSLVAHLVWKIRLLAKVILTSFVVNLPYWVVGWRGKQTSNSHRVMEQLIFLALISI